MAGSKKRPAGSKKRPPADCPRGAPDLFREPFAGRRPSPTDHKNRWSAPPWQTTNGDGLPHGSLLAGSRDRSVMQRPIQERLWSVANPVQVRRLDGLNVVPTNI